MKGEIDFDVVIVGGGLAGLISAIQLSKSDLKVLLIEKNEYPKHKVCGEYISNEVLPYLKSLDVDPFELGAQKINRFLLSTTKNKTIESKLPLGGFGISRYTFDAFLAKKAQENGTKLVQDTVIDIQFTNDLFKIITKKNNEYVAKTTIGAYGKRDSLDIKLNRNFIKKESPYLAVKTHVKGHFSDDLVALHNFKGGYCGVSRVENDIINLCYIVDYKAFKKFKNIDAFQKSVLFENEHLKTIFSNTDPIFTKALTISQISFAKKAPVEDHILMCGDTAGLIHPLCGNGMSMAIHSGQLASNLIIAYHNGTIQSRTALEKMYIKVWNKEFKKRLTMGRIVASLFRMNHFSEFMLFGLKSFPSMLPKIIKQTHGKPMLIS